MSALRAHLVGFPHLDVRDGVVMDFDGAGLRFGHQFEVVREVRGTDQRTLILRDLRDVAVRLDVGMKLVDVDVEVRESILDADDLREVRGSESKRGNGKATRCTPTA